MLGVLSTFFEEGHASVIVGGQFGSEAKGLAAAIVAKHARIKGASLVCTTNAGAQAGHTTVLEDGRKFVCYHLPTVGVLKQDSMIYINGGSVINPKLLQQEILDVCAVTGEEVSHMVARIVIHPTAAVITDEHQQREMVETTHLGSTRKGIGAALADKIMRKPGSVVKDHEFLKELYRVSALSLDTMLDMKFSVCIEVPQGTGLSINGDGKFFPCVTSRECWIGQGMTDAGIHPSRLFRTLMVVRTMPIRVGHIYDGDKQVGDSGPFYDDSIELDWKTDLAGIEPEITTVTKRRRRIATFSFKQYEQALRLNRPSIVLLTFCNYITPEDHSYIQAGMAEVENRIRCWPEHLISDGPKVSDTSLRLASNHTINWRHV